MSTLKRIGRPRAMFCLVIQAGLIFAVLYGLARMNQVIRPAPIETLMPAIGLTTALFFLLALATQRAVVGPGVNLARELTLFAVTSLLAGSLLAMSFRLSPLDSSWHPIILAMEGIVAVPLAIGIWRWVSVRFEILDNKRERLLIVGTGQTAQSIGRLIGERFREFAIAGFADENPERVGSLVAMGARIQADYRSLPKFARGRIDRVVVALDEKRGKLPVRELMEIRLFGIEVEDATSFIERTSGRVAVESLLPSWLIFSDGFKVSPLRSFLKRATDITHAIGLLVVSAPLMILTAMLIKLDSRGPVLYRQARMGLFGEEYMVLKFRSMRQDAEQASGPTWAQADDPRVTRVGRIIRKLRIDELPQIFNVLKGEMSFVGPRPERRHFVQQLSEKLPFYSLRMIMRPGITGWAQVEYGYGANENDALEKLKYDLFYIKNNNLLFDLGIVLKTIKVVLLGSGR